MQKEQLSIRHSINSKWHYLGRVGLDYARSEYADPVFSPEGFVWFRQGDKITAYQWTGKQWRKVS